MVRLSHKTSHLHTLSMGVPQETCLGPVQFLLYVNDLPSNITSCLSIMYADDTTLISAASNLDEVNSILAASNWFFINRLIVNSKNLTFCLLVPLKKFRMLIVILQLLLVLLLLTDQQK